ncbi:MAG: leucine-rich repeat domain-containing protein [Prevotella sp.]|nr:leucine-rich repeat domain-containing protein [Prevotella sp.]
MKKLLLLLLTLLLLPMAVSAEDVEIDGIYYRIDDGQAIVISHPDKYSGDIVIPSTVNGGDFPVTGISTLAFGGCSELQSVTIPNSVTSIGDDAFNGCFSLESINIPGGVTYIGGGAFANCSSLTSITIPSSVTSIGGNAFYYCTSLTSINIPSSVTSIGGNAFYYCASLTSINIPSSVTSIGGNAFNYCSRLTSINIPSSVTSIGESITSDCVSLTSIVVEEGNPQYDSRDNCNAIIDKDENKLIAGCKNTVIPSSVTTIGEKAFQGQPMTSIVIPGSVTALENRAFAYCSALTDVYCLAENVPSTDPYAFYRSSYESATLYVLPTSVEKYKAAAPWKNFGTIMNMYQCAKPTIASANGKLTFSCKTEGVEFVASVSPSGKTTYKGSSLLLADLTTTYRVSVYARKAGYEDSEAATIDIAYLPDLDDVNGDGQISISDVVGIVDIILKGN